MSDLESRWVQACDALTAMARAYASAMQVDLAEARERSQTSILRYLAAGHWPARAGAYHCEFRKADGSAAKLEKVRNTENDAWVLPNEYWQLLQRSGAHLNANWHLGEFDLPTFRDDTGSYSGFARRVEFDRTYVPVEWLAEDAGRTHDPGRPAKGYTLYLLELRRRTERGDLLPSLAQEAQALLSWLQRTHPGEDHPTAKTIENRIRGEYRRARSPTK